MRRDARLLAGAAAMAVAALVAGRSVYASFTSTTWSADNRFSTGTVAIGDNDGGSAMLTLDSVSPGTSDTGCIKVTYTGSLTANVRFHGTVTGGLAPYLNLTVTRGTETAPSFDSCATFANDATDYIGAGPGVVYDGTLAAFPTAASPRPDPTATTQENWTTGEAHSYRFVVTLANNAAAQGLSATAAFSWEARSQ